MLCPLPLQRLVAGGPAAAAACSSSSGGGGGGGSRCTQVNNHSGRRLHVCFATAPLPCLPPLCIAGHGNSNRRRLQLSGLPDAGGHAGCLAAAGGAPGDADCGPRVRSAWRCSGLSIRPGLLPALLFEQTAQDKSMLQGLLSCSVPALTCPVPVPLPPLQATAAAITRGAEAAAAAAIQAALTSNSPFAAAFAAALGQTGTSQALCAAINAAKVGAYAWLMLAGLRCNAVNSELPPLQSALPASCC